MPRTMPVSTAHSTCGYRCAASPNGQCSDDERERVAARLGVRGESVRGQRVGDRRDRGLHRAVALGRVPCAPRWRGRTRSRPLRPAPRASSTRQPLERAGEQRAEQVVAPGREGELRVDRRRRGSASTAGPAGLVALELDVEVAAGRELLEMVAGDVGVERRSARRPRPPSRPSADERGRRGRCRGGSGRRRRW